MLKLSAAERLALLKLARARAPMQAPATLSPIEPVERGGPLPLSFAQQRLWFLEQLGGAGAAYHVPTRLRLKGALHRAALVRALDRIVARHEALRTTLHEVDGEPVQRIAPVEESGFQLREHDLAGHPEPEAELRRLIAEETGAPFDLARGPLLRGRLVRRADDDHVLLVTMHHIVSDGWSMGVFTRELTTLYEAFQRGEPDPLPPLPVQYADYAAWQRRWVTGQVLKAQAEYWKSALGGAPELLELPTDHARPARQDLAGATVAVELDEELSAGLKALSQRHGATLYMTLLAGWAIVLSRLAGQDDVVVGSPMAGRGRSEIEELIGFFVNTLAIRVDLSGGPTVAELLERVKERVLGAQQHQDIPFEQVVELLEPARSLAHTPLFQVMFAWQNTPRADGPRAPGLAPGAAALAGRPGPADGAADEAPAKFDLSLTLSERGGRITGSVTYATSLFERESVERWIGYLRRVLTAMAADERQPVEGLSLLPESERARVLEEWNRTEAAYPAEACIHELFEAQAERTPRADAVVFEGESLTYAELNARANRLAHHLRTLGVGPGARVGVCLERGVEMVVGLLAILKAGGAYVPLDPAYPAQRLRHMLEDSAPVALLTQSSLSALFAGLNAVLIELDAADPAWAALPETNPARGALTPVHRAYVIYTSGSTGQPKGVMVEHRGLVNHTAWQAAAFGIGAGDSVLQRTSISFDASVWELWTPLSTGARMVLLASAAAKDPAAIAGVIGQAGVTVAQFVPTLLQAVLAARPADTPIPCRTVFCGGEPLPAALVEQARAAGVGQVVNLYGPTEATIDATWHPCAAAPDGRAPAIGRPVANARVYVLDRRGQPVPAGVAGELYVGGAGVARGYLKRPAMTAERFVPDPFHSGPGARMYRTGDRARWRADGTLEFLGRADFQVKVRGFRIEPGEIEARLLEHPGVRAAVVLAREDAPGDRRLVAYWAGDAEVGVDALRAHLAERLPEHMVPAAYVRLPALPLTPNGKVDRRALPAPEGDAFATRAYEAPLGEAETTVAQIWSELLGVKKVGRWDHFFALGGHSLRAVQVVSRVRQALGVEAALGDLFVRPVLADFARGLATARRAGLPAIEPADRGADLPLSFAQQRLWFLDRLERAGAAYHMPMRLRLQGELDREALARALDRIVARHEALRTTFAEVDGAPVQRLSPESRFHLVEQALDGHPDAAAELRRVMAAEAEARFDLARGPLIRGRLVRLAPGDHMLLVTLHHIVSDGWSMGVLTRELAALYGAFHAGEPDPLPPLPVQYADYAVWQRRWVGGEVLRRQAEYWRRTLAGAPELLELPTDHPRPARQDFAGAAVSLVLDEELTAGLKALSRRHGTTLFMTLLAGWATVLARLSGQDDVVVGTPTANRGRPEIEGLIGFFVNTLALRVELSGTTSVAELLERVKDRSLGAQQNQDIPFEQVVELVRPARTLSHSPLFQVMLAWQNAPAGGRGLPGLKPAPAGAAPHVTAKFDLMLSLGESGGRIAGGLEYATSLFERETVERWLGYLRRVLEGMAADDRLATLRLPMLSQDERQRVLWEWNATEAAYPRQACVHHLVEAQAARTPGAVALVFAGERLTYAELNARANRLAHHLRGLGVGPDARVGICVERGVEMVVGLLAILKAGGAYVPLDAGYPVERLRWMMEDSAPAVLLTHPPLAATVAALAAGSTVPVIDLGDDGAWAGRPETDPRPAGLGPGSLAYVIFTSGSTGRPKGVMLEHGSLVNRLAWMQDRYAMEPGEALLQKTPFSFDVSFWEFFWPLMVGARLVMARPDGHRDPAYLAETIRREGITVVHFVPSMLQLFLEHPDAGRCTGLRRVPVSGEAISPALVRHFHQRLPGVGLYNQYGPTESGEVTEWACAADPARGGVSIGRAIHNSAVYVLDRAGQPVPVGVAGELFIGGVAVARGYLGRPRLTAERFAPDPFGGPGARMYRTGDRARWLADGTLEFLGRTDFQVKVRGFRVEPGEIEARLAEHPEVREAVVLALDDGAGGRRLAAWYVGDAPVEADALRAHLSAALPEYMVPSALVWMPAFPVTPNGKLDRAALPAPDGDAFAPRGEYQAPLGDAEQALAAIWGEVLGVERVGRRDHFFELGGHSLLAVRVISRVRQVLGTEVPLGDLFERPVLADFARGVETAAHADLPPIAPAEPGERLRPSFAQQRLWFIHRLEGAGAAYNLAARLRLKGELDRGALARALDRIVARHEALRTTFPETGGVPAQIIAAAEESPFHLAEHDLEGRPDARRELGRLMADEADAPFDLARGPLIRGRLVRLAVDDHVLLVTMHHIVSDGWSMGVFTRELGALYGAFRAGGPDPLPPLPVQYADYAAWQRRWVEGEVLRRQAEYWRRTLDGAPELLELPADHARPARQDFAGASVGLVLDAELTAGLKALGARHGATLFMTLLAGWATVLSRLSGQDDVVIGTPTANRGRCEIEGLIGFFVNTLALRVDLSASPSVAELLGRVRERALGAQHHPDIPFEQVVELVQPARSLAHTPLFQVLFAWQNAPDGGVELPGLALAPAGSAVQAAPADSPGSGPAGRVAARFDLSLSLHERGGRIAGVLEYATSLFERETVERWLGYLRRVLEGMVAGERASVERLELLPPAERRRVVEEFNHAPPVAPREPFAHERFQAQAARTPGAAALVWEGETLHYAELNARANRLAHHLRALGVGPEARVAICVERGPAMVTGALAVLKAGGAYLPLDPAYPAERLRYMLDDGAPVALLTEPALRPLFADTGLPVVELGAAEAAWDGLPATDPERGGLEPGHLAYVIYTSGSTGRPKGVRVAHGSLAATLAAAGEAFGFGAGDHVPSLASFAFDIWLFETLLPLLHGGTVRLVPRDRVPDVPRLVDDLAGCTVLHAVPALMRRVVEEVRARPDGVLRALRRAFVGGDAVAPDLLEEMRTVFPSAEVHVLYGPTEGTIICAAHRLGGRTAARQMVGRPLGNATLYVREPGGGVAPVGVPGELCLGGASVARDYLGRPGLTAERFVPDPFSSVPGERLYRTGDRVRWLARGELEFLGRTDRQVKVRGFRIEPEEIEARLAEHPAVREAVVLVREDSPGDRRLVAYCVAEAGAKVDAEALRAHLGRVLPEYMVPAAYVALGAFPLTPNGKVDRRALPAPEGDAFARRGYQAPVGETEEAVAAIWAEVLRTERVGRWDHFFELGGHSLLAVQVISRVRQALGTEVALGGLFERPVLADFARGVETAARADLPPIVPVERGGRLEPSFAQQRLWFIDRLEGAGAAYHIPVRLRLKGELDRPALARALDRIVARHEALRTTFPERDGVPAQRIAPAEESPFHLAEHDLAGRPDGARELGRLMADEANAAFDLARGPLIRGRLVRLASDDHVLLVTMHHIVSDGWSMGIFTRELGELYGAFRAGRPDPLPALPVQYADYAAWQRRWVDGEVLRRQAEYWQETLAGAPELLELPADHARPARQDFAGSLVGLVLDGELTAGLKALAARHGATLFMTLLAGWATVLSRLSGQDDVVIGTPTAGRGRGEIEGLIGFFVNTLALRVDLSASPSVAQLVGRVRERALGAQHHQDIPFEQVVELVQPVRSLSHTPLFQVLFAWQNAPEGSLELPGLALAPLGAASSGGSAGSASSAGPAAQVTAKFDLSLSLSERGGRIVGSAEYATALFERETVERWLGYLRRVLQEMVADDDRGVDALSLLPEAERRQVVEEWNDTGAGYPRGACVHDLFQAQAARTPGAVALSWRGQRLGYAELEARANRLAHALRRRGVGPEVRVGVCLPRTPELVVALLGVLKAGGAYVPLDPAYPRERLGYMLEDAAIPLVITESALADRLPPGAAALLLLDHERDAIAAEPAGAPESGVTPENLSHLIFTSGSTGRPKGVMIRHSSMVILLHWLRENVTGRERSSVLFSTSINFDVSVAEIFGTLAWGGTLVLVENALELATLDEDVVHVSMVPSAAAELLRSGGIPACVKTLNLGGEALPAALARELYALGTVEKVGNLYGPTEDTTYSTYHVVPRGAEQVRIGRPVANTRAYVVDRHLHPVPVGAVGELYLAGDGLSRGYANRPAMTAERFIPCPFGPPGARMYRVMDRVRWRPGGELEYLGRIDFQVKVRGYRIELGEIEARLREHPDVREAVVLAREDEPGDRRLVAYYTGGPAGADLLRAHLAERVPEYMVPAAYVWLDAFPRTPNGKVDRLALAAPEVDAYAAHEYQPPVGDTEQALAEIWAEVLGTPRVGRRDNFFELGGHSLLAVRIVSRVRQVLQAEVALAHVFSHPTVESLAARLSGSQGQAANDRAIAIRAAGSRPPLFLVYDGTGSTAYAQVLHPHVDGEVPVYALPAPPFSEPPLRTVEEMAARLVGMVREVQPAGPYRVAGWSLGGILAYEIAAQLTEQGGSVEFVGMFDSSSPTSISIQTGDASQEHALLLHVLRMAETIDGAEDGEHTGSDEEVADAGDAGLEAFITTCREKGLLPGHVTVTQARLMRDRLRNHQRAVREYRPRPIPAAIHLFPALQSPESDPARGWPALLPGMRLRVTPVPGSHLTMLRTPHAAALGGALSDRLDHAWDEVPSGEGTPAI